MRRSLTTCLVPLAAALLHLPVNAAPRLLPLPGEVVMTAGTYAPPESMVIAVASGSAEDRFAANLLRQEWAAWGHARVGVAAGNSGDVILKRDGGRKDLGEEGYELEVSTRRIVITAGESAGLFYGVQTLRQLIEPDGTPCVRIRDRPGLRWRGVLEDVSRGPVPTLATLERRVEQLSELKVNLYALYFENTLTYSAHPLGANPDAAMSQEELRELCGYAARYHVVIMPLQQSLGHMAGWLSYERYKPLAGAPGSGALAPDNKGTLEFLTSLYSELARSAPGPFVHIGGDEAASPDSGQATAAAGAQGASYLKFLRDAHGLLATLGKTTVVWGDVLLGPSIRLGEVPRDVVVATWKYEALPDYAAVIEPFRKAGLSFFVCPGAWNWRRLFPDITSAIQNIRVFTRQGRQAGAIGQLDCTWGDGGEALFPLAWYPVAYGAAAAWQETDPVPLELQRCFDWCFFRSPGHEVADAEEKMGRIHGSIQQTTQLIAEPQFAWLDPFHPVNRLVFERVASSAATIARDQEQAIEAIAFARPRVRRNAQLLDYLDFAARRIHSLALRATSPERARELYLDALAAAAPSGDRKRAGADVSAIRDLCAENLNHVLESRDAFERLWLLENRPGGLRRVLARYDADTQMWLGHAEEMRLLRLFVATGRPLPSAEEVGLGP